MLARLVTTLFAWCLVALLVGFGVPLLIYHDDEDDDT